MNDELATAAGLHFCGYDDQGQPEYIGKRDAWQKYEALENQQDA